MESITQFIQHNTRLLTNIASFALVIAMAVTLANGVVFFVEHLSQAEVTTVSAAAPVNRARDLDTSAIRNLFGRYQASSAPQPVDAPKTTLNLELQGIFTTEDPAEATAIVAQRGQSGELYRIGDRLPGNATLEAVFADHILIKRGARTEKLPFLDSALMQGFRQSNNNTASAGLGNNVTLLPNPVPGAVTQVEQVRERIARRSRELAESRRSAPAGPATDLRGAMENFQKRLDENPDELLTELGVSAVDTTGGSGYRLDGQVDANMLRRVGLQQGDVILSVNGKSATAVANNRELVSEVMNSDRVRVEVQRGERRFFVAVPVPK